MARFGNLATSIAEAMRKAKPKDPPPEGVFVTSEAMQAKAEQGEAMLERLAAALHEDEATWPVCPACRRPVPPANVEERAMRAIEGVSR